MRNLAPYIPFIAIIPGFLFYAGYAVAAMVSGVFGANRDLTKTLKAKNEELQLEINQRDHLIAGLRHELHIVEKKKLEPSVEHPWSDGTYSDNVVPARFVSNGATTSSPVAITGHVMG